MAKPAKKTEKRKTGKPTTLSEKAYREIKDRLISARYAPGKFLQESEICADTGLGRTPVHQALHRLQQQGMIQIIPRKGVLVKSESLAEIMVALEARELVESFCAGQCALRATEAELLELRGLLDKYVEVRDKSEKAMLMELDRRFHTRIGEIAGNPLFVDFLRPIHERMSRMWFLPHWQFHDFNMTEGEHERLFAALQKRDSAGASAAMTEHIASLKRRITNAQV